MSGNVATGGNNNFLNYITLVQVKTGFPEDFGGDFSAQRLETACAHISLDVCGEDIIGARRLDFSYPPSNEDAGTKMGQP